MAHKSLYSSARMTMRTDKSFFTVTLDDDEPIVSTLKLYHGKSFYDFNFDEESDGTRRIFDLLDMLLNKNDDIIYVVDELERSLHPKLTEHFLELFMNFHKGHKTQLLFTTHEASIMEQKLLDVMKYGLLKEMEITQVMFIRWISSKKDMIKH